MRRVALAAVLVSGAAAHARGDDCADLRVAVPTLEHISSHDVAIPELVDFGEHSLDTFYEKLARVARGTPGATLRIGTYGDSNWTNDRTAGEIRRRLQGAFGDAGHGWVAFGDPWGWYHHQNLQHGLTGTWTTWNPTTNENFDGLYGFAGISTESTQIGATVWAETAKPGDPVGTAVSAFEVYYLVRPNGGAFEVLIDGQSKETIDTVATTTELRYRRYSVTDGPHRLTAKVKRGRVRLFGVTLERDATGVVVDGLGVGALNANHWARMNPALLATGLTQRGYDLIIETSGTNTWSSREHPGAMAKIIGAWRAALPNASLLLWSPPDYIAKGKQTSEPRMRTVTKEKQDIAKANGIAFWDQYEALGGWGSMPRWHKAKWAEPDGVHFAPKLNAYVGERFVHVMLKELARRVDRDPRLGCGG